MLQQRLAEIAAQQALIAPSTAQEDAPRQLQRAVDALAAQLTGGTP
ncbi:MAG: hypothetical protein IPM30_05260 [Burkholderiales bacterium]|nr:hypothetical protein [Burkholderiales bacterium]